MQIKALSFWQPWGTLIIIGAKRFETRGRYTNLRGENIGIHAAKTAAGLEAVAAMNARDRRYIMDALHDAGIDDMRDLPFGAMLGIAEIAGCWPTKNIAQNSNLLPEHERDRELAMGDFSAGRYGWYMRDPFKFNEPIQARGQQGFWEWEIPQEAYNTIGLGTRLAERPFQSIWERR